MPRKTSKTNKKKVKVIGSEEYINSRTGEVETFNVIRIEDRDFNFHKIWLAHILDAIDELGNAKIKVLTYLLENRQHASNMVVRSYEEIARDTGTSVSTVVRTVKCLEKHDILRRKKGTTGILFLNPNVIFKGPLGNRLRVLFDYHQVGC